MGEDGWLIGYGMATTRYDVPAPERIHATLAAVHSARSAARRADRAGEHLDRAPSAVRPATRLAVRIGSSRKGHRADEAASRRVHRVHGENVTGDHADRPSPRYRIRVRGRLGDTMRSAFPALQAQASGGDTVLTGPLPDGAALYGVLAQLEALGLELLEVRRLPPV